MTENEVARVPIAGEPVWSDLHKRHLTLTFESVVNVQTLELGEADRPSEVARLLRQAAADIEQEERLRAR